MLALGQSIEYATVAGMSFFTAKERAPILLAGQSSRGEQDYILCTIGVIRSSYTNGRILPAIQSGYADVEARDHEVPSALVPLADKQSSVSGAICYLSILRQAERTTRPHEVYAHRKSKTW